MNSPDIRISTTLPRHRKFKRFKRYVGAGAMEYLVCLWGEVAEQAPTGELKGWSDEDIAEAATFTEGDPKWFVEMLVACGLLDACSGHYLVHDWAEHQSYLVGAPARIAKAKYAARKRWGCSEHATSMPAVMPPQLPSVTKHSSSNDEAFDLFWKAYPKKVGKEAARRAWVKARINGRADSVILAVESQKQSKQWQEEGGRFIPNPATWLNQGRWDDELEVTSESDREVVN